MLTKEIKTYGVGECDDYGLPNPADDHHEEEQPKLRGKLGRFWCPGFLRTLEYFIRLLTFAK